MFHTPNDAEIKAFNWYVVNTRAQKELHVADGFKASGFATYVPMQTRLVKLRNRRGGRVPAERPAFVAYVFLGMLPDREDWNAVHATEGFAGVCQWGNRPCLMPPLEVQRLRNKEVGGAFDTRETATAIRLEVGQRVRIVEGPGTGFEGTVTERQSIPDQPIRIDLGPKMAVVPLEKVQVVA